MKKALAILALAVTSLTSYGQGYFLFGGGVSTVYDGFLNNPALRDTNVNVGFMWGSGTALITSVATSVPTNATSANISWSVSGAWTAILSDPNYTLAVNSGTSQVVAQRTAANGSWSYNGGSTFGVTGTSPSTTYNLYVIGWDANYATPALAQAANAGVGWSAIFSYTSATSIGTPVNTSTLVGRFGTAGAVPEPSTMVLAGLGAASLLLFRRRK